MQRHVCGVLAGWLAIQTTAVSATARPDTGTRLLVWCLIFPYTALQSVPNYHRVNSASISDSAWKTGPHTLGVKQCSHINTVPLPQGWAGIVEPL